ncbi:MAG: mechanosensitive ion channel family protein [Candidatus Nezhaarchaeota archaeon]|nr:mechanosensitive ion channel family protein [Candidatus Nezhaarchaeota archaeon]
MSRGFLEGNLGGWPSGTPETVISLIMVFVVLGLAYTIYRLVVARIMDNIFRRFSVESSVAVFWRYVALVVIMLMATIMSISFFGELRATIYVILGIILGAIVFMLILGSKDVIMNALSGYALMLYKPFKRGEMILVDGKLGYVRDVSTIYTEIVREDGVHYIPNAELVKRSFVVKPMDSLSKMTLHFNVEVDADVELVEQIVKEAVKQCREVAPQPEPEVYLVDINGQCSKIKVVVKVVNPKKRLQAKSTLLRAIKEALMRAGIRVV